MSFATVNNAAPATSIDAFVDQFERPAPTLLAVWAHPDDESYLGAGLMAEVAARGGRVVNVTASLGEHGTEDPVANPPEELAARRHAELISALGRLGASEYRILGHADGACGRVPDRLGARTIASVIDEVEPDMVVGFGPDGVTGHPDHCAVARWTARAVAQRGDQIPLLTTAADAAWPAELIDGMHEVGAFWPNHPRRPLDESHETVRLEARRLEQKLAALACHESQIGPLQRSLGVTGYRRLAAIEAYRAGNAAAARFMCDDRALSAA